MTLLKEEKRLKRLQDIGILDTPESRDFRDCAAQALGLFPGASIAAISLVDQNRQWFKTIIGLNVKETPRSLSFCSHTIETEDGVMVVEDATRDSRFSTNTLVTSSPGVRFYAGVKLMDGVGALCVIGTSPRQADASELVKLKKLANYVDIQLLAHGTLFNLP
ncbi:GAF domain-containing protein [Pararhizobium arenae]|uniref:GAF domain-containing protein n=1 Tax=Pararhizobium arenae TaxID=1856850 RepID=UPI00094B6DCE|nr:GAF domain-containing protein [Pararhizobium arenae]